MCSDLHYTYVKKKCHQSESPNTTKLDEIVLYKKVSNLKTHCCIELLVQLQEATLHQCIIFCIIWEQNNPYSLG
jgi:hypothetical protein